MADVSIIHFLLWILLYSIEMCSKLPINSACVACISIIFKIVKIMAWY